MDNRDLQELANDVEEIRDIQSDLTAALQRLLGHISEVEGHLNEHFNLSFVLKELREMAEAVDVDSMFGFLTDLENEIGNMSYKYKRAEKANSISVYKVLHQQAPMYFSAKPEKNPGTIIEIVEDK